MSALKVYSASQVTFNFAGIPVDNGLGSDEFCEISKTEDVFTYKAGIDGEGTRSESKNSHHKVTLTLMQSSSMNAVLSLIHSGDMKVAGGLGIAPLLIRDRQGTTLFASAQAWIVKVPDWKAAKEGSEVKWVFDVHDPQYLVGGN